MAIISNYTTLQAAVADYLARSDLTTFIPNFIQNFEEDFFRDPENYFFLMESPLAMSISNGRAESLPSDYLAVKMAYFSSGGSVPLKRLSVEQLFARYPINRRTYGTPVFFAEHLGGFEFGPTPEDGDSLIGSYYAKPTALRSAGSGINAVLLYAADLYLYGSLLAAEPFLKNDDRIAVWQSFYERALGSFRRLINRESYGGSALFTVAV